MRPPAGSFRSGLLPARQGRRSRRRTSVDPGDRLVPSLRCWPGPACGPVHQPRTPAREATRWHRAPRRRRAGEVTSAHGERLLAVLDEGRVQAAARDGLRRTARLHRGSDARDPAGGLRRQRATTCCVPTGLGSKMPPAVAVRSSPSRWTTTTWPSRRRGNITVIGPSRLISDPGQVTALNALGVRPWTPARTHSYIALRMAVVRGRRISFARGAHLVRGRERYEPACTRTTPDTISATPSHSRRPRRSPKTAAPPSVASAMPDPVQMP